MVWSTVQDPAIQPRPPMGFNNWARFMCDLNQTLFTDTADAMLENGLLDAGYEYINIDDCWLEYSRAENGSLVWNSTLFPDGLIWLGEYLHERGFKYGIYQDAGNLTCGGYPGSRDYEDLDAKTFEAWGIDYLKLDGCNVINNTDPRPKVEQYRVLYEKWHKALEALDKPLVFSESAPAYFSPDFQTPPHSNNTDWYTIMKYMPEYGELARHSNDVKIWGFDGIFEPGGHWDSIMTNYGHNTELARYQQKCGFYNDPDFLIPFPDLTEEEKRSHFSLWASFSAPLIISAYIPELPESDIKYLSNKDIIAVDQDSLCLQATLVSQDGYWDVLTKSLENGDRLLTVLNRGNNTNSTLIPLERVGISPDHSYSVKDLWTGKTFTVSKSISLHERPSHSTAVLRIRGRHAPKLDITPTGMIFNTYTGHCLTTTRLGAQFETCNASDEQIWQTTAQGALTTLGARDTCLGHNERGNLKATACHAETGNVWTYYQTGNLMAGNSALCLAEAPSGQAVLEPCHPKADPQVLELPGGVTIH
ncbi:glycoside hydrolase [Pseudovirgaria hyperparasitica]|uniref:Alpha-galactosidase n=1 Tax=Pseudovirgaria hyperparasitica TaxID=470096 RepID=A0A6A6WAI1_9PEZI|nr:glycoside hydrolase [Pseudovirgaria hyperparasitica]KAF2759868.1 glycoside hydrolase [Pseudovirgaria hyperparasitica]